MKTLLVVIITTFTTFSQTKTEIKKGGKISVEGTAIDAKAGAMIYGPGVMFFVEGLSSWPKEMLNKQISVKGRLITDTTTFDPKDKSVVPQYMPVMKVIKRAKYHVVD